MTRTTQGIVGTIVTGALVALHYAGLAQLPEELLTVLILGLLASLGLGAHGMSRRVPRGDYAKPKGYASTGALAAMAVAGILIIGLAIAGCGTAVCKRIEIHRYDAKEHGAEAQRVVQKCGAETVEWILTKGTPDCMDGCWRRVR